MISHADEISAREPRTWIMSEDAKATAKTASRAAHEGVSGISVAPPSLPVKKAIREKTQSTKDKAAHKAKVHPAAAATTRALKRARRPQRMTVHTPEEGPSAKKVRARAPEGVILTDCRLDLQLPLSLSHTHTFSLSLTHFL